MRSVANLVAIAGALSGSADAFWRMRCPGRTGLARMDPLVEPGEIGSHAHAIHGGKNFNLEITYDQLAASECTSCQVKQDKSAYWTPSMHFVHENGTTEVVPQIGGMLAYYLLFRENGQKLHAFPEGFRMLVGDSRLRNFSGPVPDPGTSFWGPEDMTQHALTQKAIGFNCLNYGRDPEASMGRHFLPDKDFMDANCPQGIRAEIMFPSCWNGELDSPDHKSHMAFPNLKNSGTCPDGYDKRTPTLFFETTWLTSQFNGVLGTFMLSSGDPVGYGYHADFISGWPVDFLQQAIETCTSDRGEIEDCPLFMEGDNFQSKEDAEKCKFDMPDLLKDEDCAGPANSLPGNVPVQYGPAYADPLKPGPKESPTEGTPLPATTEQVVPTATFVPATTQITDEFGGGLSNANAAAYSLAPEPLAVDAPEAAATTTSAPPAPEAPAPTTPPLAEEPEGKIIATSTYTSAGTVYEVAIEEIVQYVTVEVPAPAPKLRRHHHHMHRRDREHGLLGRRY
ncbi:hypothetical protein CC78DRAFT_457652 [Lojkania enalia]|uniref:DUF1996 domain-containing protein n=1 Tax=Lojkania enalia TaxID=147567 RepID=A0A9P4KIK2_9PLEO|nr:hypothetical protein CC78DRAFT_457652 [Didymosphaeria enalia]